MEACRLAGGQKNQARSLIWKFSGTLTNYIGDGFLPYRPWQACPSGQKFRAAEDFVREQGPQVRDVAAVREDEQVVKRL